jgi:hypothetical protein
MGQAAPAARIYMKEGGTMKALIFIAYMLSAVAFIVIGLAVCMAVTIFPRRSF